MNMLSILLAIAIVALCSWLLWRLFQGPPQRECAPRERLDIDAARQWQVHEMPSLETQITPPAEMPTIDDPGDSRGWLGGLSIDDDDDDDDGDE
jgi:hypothetical protein